jgi:predicted 2-oxoglutarate/Fe(II)-dependent dioxygenase YbiX
MAAPVGQLLLEALAKIDRPGTFCTSGTLPPIFPGLEVAGVGPISLPLEKRQAAALRRQARQAPYGKGTQTLVDTDVRRVWEIDADQLTLANPQWAEVLKAAVDAARSVLGLEQRQLEAHLYKLLLYESGSFFLAHRDGEKLDRMVATLVVTLPSAHEGGQLIVRHEGREEAVDFSSHSRFQTQFAAFYADCEHEIRPVTKGFRLSLVYNLTLAESKRTIRAPTRGEHVVAVARILGQWSSRIRATPDASAPSPLSKLAVLLDHQYSQAGLTRDALKGVDRARADVLFAAAREAGCDASLALVTYWESGSAEPSDAYEYRYRRRRRYGRYDDEGEGEHVMGEVFDQSLKTEHFSDAEGNRLAYGQIPLDEEEIVSKQPLNEGRPDEEDFEGYTGNAGMTLQRWYHRAAILLWPAESRFDVLCEAGMNAAVGGLEQMVARWKQAEQGPRETLKQSCLEFAARIIAGWPERQFLGQAGFEFDDGFDDEEDLDGEDIGNENLDDEDLDDDDLEDEDDLDDEEIGDEDLDDDEQFTDDDGERGASKVSRRPLLSLLKELGDVALVSAWIGGVLTKDASVDPGETLGDLCEQHGWKTFQGELRDLFANTSNETLERHARLLADWSTRRDEAADRRTLCSRLLEEIIAAVERWSPNGVKRDWRARVVDRRQLLVPLVQALLALEEPELFERLVTYVLERPKAFDRTTVQLPALESLKTWLKRNVKRPSAPLDRWLSAVVEELDQCKSHPPREPVDWRRESATGCDCDDCEELSRFLKDPRTQTLRIALPEQRRRHLHEVIDGKHLDATHVTERRGRPYTLVCTKTKASYERDLKAHHVDLEHLAKMRALLEWHQQLHARPVRKGRLSSKDGR